LGAVLAIAILGPRRPYEFTGQGVGRVKCGSANANRKFAEYAQKYAQLKAEVQGLVAQLRTGS
jgi:hypothetical protein